MTVYGTSQCTGIGAVFTIPADGSCKSTNGGYGAVTPGSTPTGGGCAHSGGVLQAERPAWQIEALLCGAAPSSGTCSAGVCAPEPPAPFGTAVCIHKAGDQACPDGFPARTLVYTDFSDTRGCADCGCGAPAGVECPISTWANDTCNGTGITLDEGVCDTSNYYSSAKLGSAVGGSCPASGGEPSGGLDPISPVTVCCAP
jgi:hypothetical protein